MDYDMEAKDNYGRTIDMKAIDNNGRTPLIWKQYIIMEGLHWYESNR